MTDRAVRLTKDDQRVYRYVVKHQGQISFSQAAKDLALPQEQIGRSIERLQSAGRLGPPPEEPIQVQVQHCVRCYAEIPLGSRFCNVCGYVQEAWVSHVDVEPIPPVSAAVKRGAGRHRAVALSLVGILIGAALVAMFLLPDRTPLTMEPTEPKAWYGNPVAFEVAVKESPGRLFPVRVENVTLRYRLVKESDFRTKRMSQSRVEQPLVWTCTIPGEYVTGDMRYYFSALTASKVETKTVEYTLHVADFSLNISPKEQQLFAGKNGKLAVTITPLWHFASSKVALSAQAASGDFSFRWSPNDLTVPRDKRAETSLDVEVKPNSYRNHTITVTAKSENVTHQDYFRIVVPDFRISARPTDILNADRRSAPTVKFVLAFESLWGDIGNVAGWDLEATELPPGVSYARNVSSVIVRKNRTEYVSFSFTVSPSTPSGQYTILLTVYAVDSPTCRKQLRLTLKIT